MSEFTVIGDIGETIKKLLEDGDWDEIGGSPEITFKSPKEIKDEGTSNNKVSLFLYHIEVNPHLRNEDLIKVNDTGLQQPPFPLYLYYLLTPYSENKTDEKYILGKAMQIFYDNAILKGTVLQGTLADSDEEFKLLFHPISLDDLTKIWTAFQEAAYRLSVVYQVTPVRIDSTREMQTQRVVQKEMDNAHMIPKNQGQ